jgi:pyruvate/2-oxoglutarate dehydrogenase complex dihydrolipoamide acyltransferase (E2) component
VTEHELRLPKLGMAMTEASVEEWLVADGATVDEGQEVVVIQTDKVDSTLDAPAARTIRIISEARSTIEVGELMVRIEA